MQHTITMIIRTASSASEPLHEVLLLYTCIIYIYIYTCICTHIHYIHGVLPPPPRSAAVKMAWYGTFRKGGYGWKPSSSSNCSNRAFRAQISQFELFELILLKLDKQLPVERFEATVSESTVPSPPS